MRRKRSVRRISEENKMKLLYMLSSVPRVKEKPLTAHKQASGSLPGPVRD
jgi:hypothetical protein